jgi:hypothetical protein
MGKPRTNPNQSPTKILSSHPVFVSYVGVPLEIGVWRLGLPQLRYLQPIRLRPVPNAFLAARQRLGDGADGHAFGGELVEFLDLVLAPGLAVAFEFFSAGHFLVLPFARA